MKRKIWGLTAIVLALSLSAFTTIHKRESEKKRGQFYWFPLDSSGNPLYTNTLIYQSWDPAYCGHFAVNYCEAAFSSYTGSAPTYMPAGNEAIIDFYFQLF